MIHEKGNKVVVCKTCELTYTPLKRPYTCPNCNNVGFWLSPHEYEIQMLIKKSRLGCKDSYEKLGKEVLIMTKKLIWSYVWYPMEHYVDEICGDILVYFFKLYNKTSLDGSEIRCVYSYLNFIANCVSTTWSKKTMDYEKRKKNLSILGEGDQYDRRF